MAKDWADRAKDDGVELLRDLLIVQLALAGVSQHTIRAIARCDINRVNRIAKHLRSGARRRDVSAGSARAASQEGHPEGS